MATTTRPARLCAPAEENISLEAPPPALQARVHLVLGPVGAGKSTFATRLAREHGAVRFALDDWMARLYSPDRPATGVPEWYVERARRALGQIWHLTLGVVERGVGVVLEPGLIRRNERERFYALVREARVPMTLHVLDAPRDVRRERVLERNRTRGPTFAMVVPEAVFELASDLWEAPDDAELADWNGEPSAERHGASVASRSPT